MRSDTAKFAKTRTDVAATQLADRDKIDRFYNLYSYSILNVVEFSAPIEIVLIRMKLEMLPQWQMQARDGKTVWLTS